MSVSFQALKLLAIKKAVEPINKSQKSNSTDGLLEHAQRFERALVRRAFDRACISTDDLLQKDYYDNGLLLRDVHVNTRDAVRTAVDYLASVVDADPQNTADLALSLKNVVAQLNELAALQLQSLALKIHLKIFVPGSDEINSELERLNHWGLDHGMMVESIDSADAAYTATVSEHASLLDPWTGVQLGSAERLPSPEMTMDMLSTPPPSQATAAPAAQSNTPPASQANTPPASRVRTPPASRVRTPSAPVADSQREAAPFKVKPRPVQKRQSQDKPTLSAQPASVVPKSAARRKHSQHDGEDRESADEADATPPPRKRQRKAAASPPVVYEVDDESDVLADEITPKQTRRRVKKNSATSIASDVGSEEEDENEDEEDEDEDEEDEDDEEEEEDEENYVGDEEDEADEEQEREPELPMKANLRSSAKSAPADNDDASEHAQSGVPLRRKFKSERRAVAQNTSDPRKIKVTYRGADRVSRSIINMMLANGGSIVQVLRQEQVRYLQGPRG